VKRPLIMWSLVVLTNFVSVAQTKDRSGTDQKDASAVKQIMAENNEWAAAERSGDKAALDRILAPGYSYTDLNGKTGTKSELLANVQPTAAGASLAAEPKKENNYDVRVYGNAAVVTHDAEFKNQDVTVKARGIDVWVKHGSSWQVVAHQWTVISGPRGESLPQEFLKACAKMSFQPEVHSLYGNAEVILSKLENDSMGLPERRGYLLLIETQDSAELAFFERVTTEESKVYHWNGSSIADLREKLTNYILANRGIACVGAQTKSLVRANLQLSDLGSIPTPLSAKGAFSHMIKRYGDAYLRVTVLLLC